MSKRVALGALALGLVLTPLAPLVAANPGVVFQVEVREVGSNAPAQTMTASVEGNLLRVEVPSETGGTPNSMIFRGDRREMIMVDHAQKSYMVMDEATMKQMTAQIGAAMAQMRQAMANMPPEQRAAIEEMMKGRGMGGGMAAAPATPAEYRRTSERATHAGLQTTKVDVFRDNRKIREHWVADWSAMPAAAEVRGAFEGMAAFAKDLLSTIAESGFGGGAEMDVYGQMAQLNGYPVVTVEYGENGQPETETRLLSAVEQTVDPATFEPPEGYSRQTMPSMGAGS